MQSPNPQPNSGPNPFADANPYAPPATQAYVPAGPDLGPSGGVWRQGKLLVMHRDARLPDRCVKSNEPTTGRLVRKLQWHHPAVYLALLANLLIYAILAMALQKKAKIEIGLSERYFGKRRFAMFVGWGLVLGSVACFGGAIAASNDVSGILALVGLLMFIVGATYGVLGARMVVAKRIDEHFVWLGGVHPAYLDELPPFPYAQR